MLTVFGTTTSPYVRRVLIVARELGVEYELVDVADAAGQSRLREATPIWKVPTAIWNGRALLDSHLITEALLADAAAPRTIAPWDPSDVDARNVMSVVDGATDSLINRFYLAREGVLDGAAPYLRKQYDRAAAALAWLDARVAGGTFARAAAPAPAPGTGSDNSANDRGPASQEAGAGSARLSLVEIALVTSLDWMRFRDTYPIDRHSELVAFANAAANRAPWADSFRATSPGG